MGGRRHHVSKIVSRCLMFPFITPLRLSSQQTTSSHPCCGRLASPLEKISGFRIVSPCPPYILQSRPRPGSETAFTVDFRKVEGRSVHVMEYTLSVPLEARRSPGVGKKFEVSEKEKNQLLRHFRNITPKLRWGRNHESFDSPYYVTGTLQSYGIL